MWGPPVIGMSLLPMPLARPLTVVSVLRTHGVGDMQAMTADLSSPDNRWEIGTIPATGNRWPLLIGTPVRADGP
jgi:hypothetical protein